MILVYHFDRSNKILWIWSVSYSQAHYQSSISWVPRFCVSWFWIPLRPPACLNHQSQPGFSAHRRKSAQWYPLRKRWIDCLWQTLWWRKRHGWFPNVVLDLEKNSSFCYRYILFGGPRKTCFLGLDFSHTLYPIPLWRQGRVFLFQKGFSKKGRMLWASLK